MHLLYENRFSHRADFRVKYRFRLSSEGGRKTGPPSQGIRSDFSFAEDNGNQQYMIYPEFEDESGNVIIENNKSVLYEGTARMWLLHPLTRKQLKKRIKIGVKCNFREGVNYTADCEIIEILDLNINPIVP